MSGGGVRPRLGWLWSVMAAAFVILAAAWAMDRQRSWDAPRWETRLFTPLLWQGNRDAHEDSLRVVAIQPRCPHCMIGLERMRGLIRGDRLVALIVDTPRRPRRTFATSLRLREVWWDRDDVWRRRWGRRVYGEILIFDRRGRWIGSSHVARVEPAPRGP